MAQRKTATGEQRLPSVGRILESAVLDEALSRLPRSVVVDAVRTEIAAARSSMNGGPPSPDTLAQRAAHRAEAAAQPSLRRAINATGVVLHTGLGRAVLSEAAREAVATAAAGHSLLELDEDSGERGYRQTHVAGLLCELTGGEAAAVFNNNAAATLLVVTALAAGREVVISRGELVEIGGSFRMPEIVRASGAEMVEVGTTNRTRIGDYAAAVSDRTGLLLRCHRSNFRIVGFTEEVPTSALATLAHGCGVPFAYDLGSGALINTADSGAGPTVTLQEAITSGCDVVMASGDKLLGGPQAGIVVGRRDLVERIEKHPLARALRVDKLTLAALEATLRLYRDVSAARVAIPTLRYLTRPYSELYDAAARLAASIKAGVDGRLVVGLSDAMSQVGGGALPGENLPTRCVELRQAGNGMSITALARGLRRHRPAVIGRIHAGALLLDPRTLEESDLQTIACAVTSVLGKCHE